MPLPCPELLVHRERVVETKKMIIRKRTNNRKKSRVAKTDAGMIRVRANEDEESNDQLKCLTGFPTEIEMAVDEVEETTAVVTDEVEVEEMIVVVTAEDMVEEMNAAVVVDMVEGGHVTLALVEEETQVDLDGAKICLESVVIGTTLLKTMIVVRSSKVEVHTVEAATE